MEKFYKIQCKTSQVIDDGSAIQFSCRNSHRVEGKCVNVKYSSEDTDFFLQQHTKSNAI